MKPIVLVGCPRPIGGANEEAGHTALLWRSLDLPVTVLPASEESADNPWPARLMAAGCKIMPPLQRDHYPPWLRECIVVDFAVEAAVRFWPEMYKHDCRLVHVPTHCAMLPHELDGFRHCPPTAVVYESLFQQRAIGLQYSLYGLPEERQVVIRGAFNAASFPFNPRPHAPGGPFVVGRLAREVPAKWPKTLWPTLALARESVPLEGDVMGWTVAMQKFSGPPPEWVRCRPPGALPVPEYLRGLHALLCIGNCLENWPRVVLEAFAAGVPVIADNQGGFREQITHLETGLLCGGPQEAARAIVRLATDEVFRLRLAERAREAIGTLADPRRLGEQWCGLFSALSCKMGPR